MKLTADEQRKVTRAILRLSENERYAFGGCYPIATEGDACGQQHTGFICTRPSDHDEPHVAHGGKGYACLAWFDDGTIIPLRDE